MSYTVIAEKKGEKIIDYQEIGSYQGEFFLISEKEDKINIYYGYFGSCSGCDALEAFRSYRDEEEITEKEWQEFVKDYTPDYILEKSFLEDICWEDDIVIKIIPKISSGQKELQYQGDMVYMVASSLAKYIKR